MAERCGAPFVPRRGSLPALLREQAAELAYLVTREREVLATVDTRVGLDVGLLHAHRAQGLAHPLLRALGPLPPSAHVLDATLGLAHDAVHVATVAGARVTGIEMSPVLFSLAESGLARLAGGDAPAAARVHPVLGDSEAMLPTLGPADAVMLSPMFDEPRRAAPGFELLRRVACGGLLTESWLRAALTAAPRVVLRARRDQPVPDVARPALHRIERGKAVDYWVLGPT